MTSTPQPTSEEWVGGAWVDLGNELPSTAPPSERVTPLPPNYDPNSEVQKMLWEATHESNQSSAKGSRVSSPRTPPKSPNSELSSISDDCIIRDCYMGNRDEIDSLDSRDWVWDWSSRPDQHPPKVWKFNHPQSDYLLSIRKSKAMKKSYFSAEFFSILLLSNLVTLILGTGIGLFLGKRIGPGAISLD